MANFYSLFKALLPAAPLLVGTVIAVQAGGCVVQLPDGSHIVARGTASVSQHVFVRDGVIEGQAPALSVVEIEV